MKPFIVLAGFVVGLAVVATSEAQPLDLVDRVEHGYADNDGVKIHYVTLGEGPLVVMLHGFPDFWYTWRRQMDALSRQFQVAAIDLRGYNRSDKPKGVQHYTFGSLMKDVIAVIEHLGHEKASTTTSSASPSSLPLIKSPLLVIHGHADTALLAAGLNDTWEWFDNELTITTIPGAGHFVQQDAPDRVTRAILAWLNR